MKVWAGFSTRPLRPAYGSGEGKEGDSKAVSAFRVRSNGGPFASPCGRNGWKGSLGAGDAPKKCYAPSHYLLLREPPLMRSMRRGVVLWVCPVFEPPPWGQSGVDFRGPPRIPRRKSFHQPSAGGSAKVGFAPGAVTYRRTRPPPRAPFPLAWVTRRRPGLEPA